MFHQRELVRIGEPEAVADVARRAGATARSRCCAASGLDADFDVAADPFFGRSGRMLAASQREQALKFEILVQIAGPEPTAVASFNYHQDHFAATYGIELADGGVAHTACLGFGLERIMLALLRDPRARRGRRGRTRCARSCGRMSDGDRRGWSACSASTRRPTGRTRCTRRATAPTPRPTATPTSSSSCSTRAATSRWRRSGSTVRMDFEGDQWTFFKPPPGRPRAAVRHRHPRDAALPAAAASRSPSSSPPAGR